MMSLHLRFLLPMYFALHSNFTLAMDYWWQALLSEQPYKQVTSTIKSGGAWYLCEPESSASIPSAESLCLDDFHYYHQHLYGEVILGDRTAHFVFLTSYQWQNWNDLILNLRKDGFVIRRVQFDDVEYDVVNALKQKTSNEVDKEVIILMNRYPPEARRTIEWVKSNEFDLMSPSLTVMLQSDGEMIEMQVTRF